jgi:hypothetical protein
MNQLAAQKATVAANFAKMDPAKRMAYLKKPITSGILKGRQVSFIQLRLNLIDTLSALKPINTKLYNAMGGDKMISTLKGETGNVMADMMGGGKKGGMKGGKRPGGKMGKFVKKAGGAPGAPGAPGEAGAAKAV